MFICNTVYFTSILLSAQGMVKHSPLHRDTRSAATPCYNAFMNQPRKMPLVLVLLTSLILSIGMPPSPSLGQAVKMERGVPSAWMVELSDPPAVLAYAREQRSLNAAATAARAQLARIDVAQKALTVQLAALNTPVLFSVQRVYNGVAILTDAAQSAAIAHLPGVAAVHPLHPKYPQNATSIPYLGVPTVWQGSADGMLPGLRGDGVRVAIIDTGIDYLHRDFAGPGTYYAKNNPAVVGDVPGYPGPRIVGGYDFVGDNYNASPGQIGYQPVPHPDPDPMDCYGHGTHVAGTLAGDGVTAAGATYTGPYDTRVDFPTLAIGPGVAPRASLYALKVFGCSGSTNVTDLALEWAVDPNQDGDFADHMDVVNLSLGSPYGSTYDTSAVAADNAALAGVIVVASAGNSGDTQLIVGTPSIADRAISVAASQHTQDAIAEFSARGPRRGDAALKPDLAAPGVAITSAASNTGWQSYRLSGTSMAAPHVAGVMALLRQAHPDWSVEELKALAMNTAAPLLHPTFNATATVETPVRCGAGRIAPLIALASVVVAYAADGSGRISMSFGAPGVTDRYTATQQLAIANKSEQELWLDVGYSSLSALPGVSVQTPSGPLRVPALTTIRVPISMTVDGQELQRVRAPADAGMTGEAWFAEESGYLYVRPSVLEGVAPGAASGQPALRVPVYAAPRPLAAMAAATPSLDFNSSLRQTLELTGTSLNGSNPPTDVVSLASVLELRLRSPNIRPPGLDPSATDRFDHADLKYVGVTAVRNAEKPASVEDSTLYFGIATWAPWSTPGEIEVNILIDSNGDGSDDFRLYNADLGQFGGSWSGGTYVSRLQSLRTFETWIEGPLNVAPAERYDSGLFFGSTLVLPVHSRDLNLTAQQSRIAFHMETDSIDLDSDTVAVVDRTPVLYYDVQQPALQFALPAETAPLVRDRSQTRFEIRLDPAGQLRTPATGVLLLHHHNSPASAASVVDLDYRWPVTVYLPVIR